MQIDRDQKQVKFPCPALEAGAERKRCEFALVGVGNPLKLEDRAGLELVSAFADENENTGVCVILLDNFTSLLGDIVKTHKKILVVDSARFKYRKTDFALIELTEGTMKEAREVGTSSHGLSWLDEVYMQSKILEAPGKIYLFAVHPKCLEDKNRAASLKNLLLESIKKIENNFV